MDVVRFVASIDDSVAAAMYLLGRDRDGSWCGSRFML